MQHECCEKAKKHNIMKKNVIIVLLALLPAMTAWSQDTITQIFRGEYFYNALPDWDHSTPDWYAGTGNKGCGKSFKEMYAAGKPIKIYGLAASLMTFFDRRYLPPNIYDYDPDFDSAEWNDAVWQFYKDTSLDDCWEYLILGLHDDETDTITSMRWGKVHRKYDTPAYYVATGHPRMLNPNFTYPMYETYFDCPLTVSDTFYIGKSQRTATSGYGGDSRYDHMCLELLIYQGYEIGTNEYHMWKWCYDYSQDWWWPLRQQTSNEYYMIFPILTPKPGSQNPDNPDPESVTEADMVSRYVTVQPNPAEKEARVLSSFGLERIEAYDGGGRQVLAREASGLVATIDVSSWPRGTYILRITTPMGMATKKLLVQ